MGRMKLMTVALKKKLKPISEIEDLLEEEQVAMVKFFHPISPWTWYVLGGDVYKNGDIMFYGVVFSPYADSGEYCFFTLEQLTSYEIDIAGLTTLSVQRDKLFKATPLVEILKTGH